MIDDQPRSAVCRSLLAAMAAKARDEMHITGQATPLAKRRLKAQGWAVAEHLAN